VGKLPASHRFNHLPLLSSDPGGVRQELIVQDLPGAKVGKNRFAPNKKKLRTINFNISASLFSNSITYADKILICWQSNWMVFLNLEYICYSI